MLVGVQALKHFQFRRLIFVFENPLGHTDEIGDKADDFIGAALVFRSGLILTAVFIFPQLLGSFFLSGHFRIADGLQILIADSHFVVFCFFRFRLRFFIRRAFFDVVILPLVQAVFFLLCLVVFILFKGIGSGQRSEGRITDGFFFFPGGESPDPVAVTGQGDGIRQPVLAEHFSGPARQVLLVDHRLQGSAGVAGINRISGCFFCCRFFFSEKLRLLAAGKNILQRGENRGFFFAFQKGCRRLRLLASCLFLREDSFCFCFAVFGLFTLLRLIFRPLFFVKTEWIFFTLCRFVFFRFCRNHQGGSGIFRNVFLLLFLNHVRFSFCAGLFCPVFRFTVLGFRLFRPELVC